MSQLVRRRHGEIVGTDVFDELMVEFVRRRVDGAWDEDRAASDRWLAPRLHFALRLTRSEAADRLMWAWIANRYLEVVQWRWSDAKGDVAVDRLVGPIHKQAFARLWWGAELFRDGTDYRTVERAFVLQDLPNSYLHRPLVRCRSLALGLLEVLVPTTADGSGGSASEVNELARVLNLVTAGCPPEVETGFQQDDRSGYLRWVGRGVPRPTSWQPLPAGPDVEDTTPESVAAGAEIARRGRELAQKAVAEGAHRD
ncbi:DUF6339 family protein [Actinomycetospora rhizophila]|uniref:DUF6339 family protein n=1 Tax=Actinomycetospora rhizophila TaxID=1416876 RepID=A0ABV9ZA62_9PSEU